MNDKIENWTRLFRGPNDKKIEKIERWRLLLLIKIARNGISNQLGEYEKQELIKIIEEYEEGDE